MSPLTGKIVDIIANTSPDTAAFHQCMDELNRFISFYSLPPYRAQQLRDFFHERRALMSMSMQSRANVLDLMSPYLRTETSWDINRKWLMTVPFFDSAEKPFLARMTLALKQDVYAPHDRPPMPRLYVIFKGAVKYENKMIGPGGTFGTKDVLLSGPTIQYLTAVCQTYVHVDSVSPEELYELGAEFPEAMWSMKWVCGVRTHAAKSPFCPRAASPF
jgi:hypothetical protein